MSTRVVVAALVVLALGGCAGKKTTAPADQLWRAANEAFDDEAWQVAVERYKAMLDQYPFDPNAEEAELRIARAHYLAASFPEAIAAFENFERMHPTSSHLAMVEYHRGMSYAMQHGSADRDQRFASSALTSFRNVIDRFPNGSWAQKSELRIRECREALASHEGVVADFYLDRGSLRSAEARLAMLLTSYADTDAAATMLEGFAEAWTDRGEEGPATLARQTLVRLHPETPEGVQARAELEGRSIGDDPLSDLLAWIASASTTATRLDVPRAVSAFPDTAPTGPRQ